MFSCGKRREPRGEDLYTSVHAMAIRSTVVDMEPTKHVPLQRPQQQQRKHSVFDGEILKSELKSIGVKPLHVLTIWTWAFSHPLCPSFFAFLSSWILFLSPPFAKERSVFLLISAFLHARIVLCLEELSCLLVPWPEIGETERVALLDFWKNLCARVLGIWLQYLRSSKWKIFCCLHFAELDRLEFCCKRWFIANLRISNRHVVSPSATFFCLLKGVILYGMGDGQICAKTCRHRSTWCARAATRSCGNGEGEIQHIDITCANSANFCWWLNHQAADQIAGQIMAIQIQSQCLLSRVILNTNECKIPIT